MASAYTPVPVVQTKGREISAAAISHSRLVVGYVSGVIKSWDVSDDLLETVDQPDHDPTSGVPDGILTNLRECIVSASQPIKQVGILEPVGAVVVLVQNAIYIHGLESLKQITKLEKSDGATAFSISIAEKTDDSAAASPAVARLVAICKDKIVSWHWPRRTQLRPHRPTPITFELPEKAVFQSVGWLAESQIVTVSDAGFHTHELGSETALKIPHEQADSKGVFGTRTGGISFYFGWKNRFSAAVPVSRDKILLVRYPDYIFTSDLGNQVSTAPLNLPTQPSGIEHLYPFFVLSQTSPRYSIDIRSPVTHELIQSVAMPAPLTVSVPAWSGQAATHDRFVVFGDRFVSLFAPRPFRLLIDDLIATGRFDEAGRLVEYVQDSIVTDKTGLRRHIQQQKGLAMFREKDYPAAMDLFVNSLTHPDFVISLYPGQVFKSATVDDQQSAVIEPSDEADGSGAEQDGSDSPSPFPIKFSDPERALPLEGADLKKAVGELSRFLYGVHTQLVSKFLNSDGTLKQHAAGHGDGGYDDCDDPDRLPEYHYLISHFDMSIPIDEIASKLHDVAVRVDTALFYAYIFALPGMVSSFLKRQNWCDGRAVHQGEAQVHFLYGKHLHRDALKLLAQLGQSDKPEDRPFRGPGRTIAYFRLLTSKDTDVILDFITWPLTVNEPDTFPILFDRLKHSSRMEPEKVVTFLIGYQKDLAIRYLEQIILKDHDQTASFHTVLANLYLEKAIANVSDPHDEDGDHDDWFEKLDSFFDSSEFYDADEIYKSVPTTDKFNQTRALVLKRLGRHREALKIYIDQMKDYDKAERYCKTVQAQSLSSQPDRPQADVFQILLDLVSNDLLVQTLEQSLTSRLRSDYTQINHLKFLSAIQKADSSSNRARLVLDQRTRRIEVDSKLICPVCDGGFTTTMLTINPGSKRPVHPYCINKER